jgi:two-component system CheB/CheR fusion protein
MAADEQDKPKVGSMPEDPGQQPLTQPDREAQPVDAEQPPHLPFAVVGVGASAGGLEAFGEFLKAMPPDSGMAFVFILHLAPDRHSLVAEVLARHTKMDVVEVDDGMEVAPDHVYVIRPAHVLTIKEGHLHLGPRLDGPRAANRPVDDFFKSLAQEQRERAVAIIMSGMGSNGAAGAQAIKAVGGLCIAQDPESAQFPSMPRHLIDAGYADFITRPTEMPEVILQYTTHPYTTGDREADAQIILQREQQHVREIMAVLRTRMKQDFSGYKKPTVLRRIQRRMGLARITEIGDYAKLLRQSASEVSALADDLLIHVTGFFRDPEAWETLRERVIVPLIAARENESSVRCWVTACSSGEEAYSLAMLLVEETERTDKHLDIKVFATDMADRTLANARNGIYPGGIEADVAPDRLGRFFEKEDATYRVRQDLRECVVFAPQNLLQDPPFSRLDIASCRNLLIYLEPEVQQRVLSLLHFGLREGGMLFLGNSETLGGSDELFEPLDKKARIFRRVGPTRHGMVDFPLPHALRGVRGAGGNGGGDIATILERLPGFRPTFAQLTQRTLLDHHLPASVLVDRDNRIMYFQGNTRPFLEQPSGEPTRDLMALAREGVRGVVRVALHRAAAQNGTARADDGWIETEPGHRSHLSVTASPVLDKTTGDYFVVSFELRGDIASVGDNSLSGDSDRTIADDLRRMRDELQSTVEELQTSNEELKASHEEVVSINEELQSSNEELETSKEEMQSLNEELTTVNTQLQAKMEEHQATNNDLTSLLTSTDIAVLFLDRAFRIRRFTPAVRELMELIAADVGRPLSDLHRKFDDPNLVEEACSVLERLVPVEREVTLDGGQWFLRRITPYRTADNRIDGVVISFLDITQRKHAALEVLRAREYAESIVETVHEPLLVLHTDLTIKSANEAFYRHFNVKAGGTVGRKIYDLGNGQWDILGLRTALEQVLPHNHVFENFEVIHEFQNLGPRVMKLNGRQLNHDQLILLGIRDVTPEHASVEALQQREEGERAALEAAELANRVKDEFLATLSHELRTPLSAILLWAKMLTSQSETKLLDEGLAAIRNSADAQKQLIEDLLDTSRITSGHLRLEMRPTELASVVDSAVESVLPAAQAKGVKIVVEVDPKIGTVRLDPDRIRQVIWNLLTNAIKFTPGGGTVNVTLLRQGHDVELRVTDTGKGVNPEFLPHMFELFRQADPTTTRNQGGLGLGLAICKKLVEQHGGTITARSDGLGRGAIFTVNLPLPTLRTSAPSKTKPSSAADPNKTSLAGIRVLLVEDERETRSALTTALRRAGAKVTAVDSAATALESYERSKIDLLVSDIGMPGEDGYSLIRKVRAKESANGNQRTPALALTAFVGEEDRRKALSAGYDRHLGKPVEPDQLLSVLTEMAAKQ